MFGTHHFVFQATRIAKILFSALEEGSRANEPSQRRDPKRFRNGSPPQGRRSALRTSIFGPRELQKDLPGGPRRPSNAPSSVGGTLVRAPNAPLRANAMPVQPIAPRSCHVGTVSAPAPCPVELKCGIENDSSPSIAPHAGPPKGVGGFKRPAATCADPWGEIAKKVEYVRNTLLRFHAIRTEEILYSALQE